MYYLNLIGDEGRRRRRGGVVKLALKYMDEEISNETHHCSTKSNLFIRDKLYRSEYYFTVVVINATFNNI
jgi:hypothetical protein